MGLPEWFKRQWSALRDETLPAMQATDDQIKAEVADLRARVERLEEPPAGGGYEGGY